MASSDLQECSICYQETNNHSFVCGKGKCSTVNCLECTISFYNHTLAEKEMPFCPGCRREITYKDVEGKDYADTYLKCLNEYLLALYSGKEEIKEKLEISALYEKIRADREMFMQNKFPVAVQLVIDLSMKEKYAKLSKTIAQVKIKDQKGTHLPCMKISCRGTLTKNWKCRLCEISFCKDCERVKDEDHTCKDEDVESVKEIRSIVKCPNCGVPIFKHSGCNNMTCASCKTMFTYSDGQIGGGGSHNEGVKIKKEYKVSEAYKEELIKEDVIDLVLEIENVPPPSISGAFGNAVMKLMNGESSEKLLLFLAKEHQLLSKKERKYRDSRRGLNEIEDSIREGKLNKQLVLDIHKRLF